MLDKMNFIETENEKYPLMFTLNVMEKIQEEYGSINAWSDLVQKEGEPDIKALKFFITEAINEGIEIENEKTGEKKKPITMRKAGIILTEVGLLGTADTIMKTITSSVDVKGSEKN